MSLLTEMLDAFAAISYGNLEPDTIRCNELTAKRVYVALRENEVAREVQHVIPEGFKWTDTNFIGARFLLDETMANGLIRLECSEFVREVKVPT